MPCCWITRIYRLVNRLIWCCTGGRANSLSKQSERHRPPQALSRRIGALLAGFNKLNPRIKPHKKMSESFADLFEESLKHTEMRTGEVITAEVIRIEHSFVVVNAGLKSEAYVPLEEFKSDKGEIEVQVGDFVSVAIGSIENGYGDTILSRDTAKRLASWMSLEKSLESGEFVTGVTSGKVKGGLTVLVNGIRAFLPGSLVDTRPTKDLSPYENKTLQFKVIKLDRK